MVINLFFLTGNTGHFVSASLVTYNFFLLPSSDQNGGQIVQGCKKPFKEVDKPFDLDYSGIF
jgi:hypothetical protein